MLEEIPEPVILVLKNYLNTKKIISATIFGSVSKGEEKEDSDIDVLVISDDFEHTTLLISNAGQEIFLKSHSRVSPIIFSKSEFKSKKKKNALIRLILDNHIMIYGNDLKHL